MLRTSICLAVPLYPRGRVLHYSVVESWLPFRHFYPIIWTPPSYMVSQALVLRSRGIYFLLIWRLDTYWNTCSAGVDGVSQSISERKQQTALLLPEDSRKMAAWRSESHRVGNTGPFTKWSLNSNDCSIVVQTLKGNTVHVQLHPLDRNDIHRVPHPFPSLPSLPESFELKWIHVPVNSTQWVKVGDPNFIPPAVLGTETNNHCSAVLKFGFLNFLAWMRTRGS